MKHSGQIDRTFIKEKTPETFTELDHNHKNGRSVESTEMNFTLLMNIVIFVSNLMKLLNEIYQTAIN